MRTADTILAVIRDRGTRGLPLERVYRLLFNRNLYLRAYAKLYPNKGAMTKGSTSDTIDGMSLAKIDTLITTLRAERYRWTPVRRVHISKKNGKTRPLGIPAWSDKLVQEVLRSILDAYYEPQFSDQSHGFRPHRGCHTALQHIEHTWKGTRWFIEGDIAQYFDTINHDVLLTILGERIHDGRLLKLIGNLLAAGYMEDWKWNKTLSGAPQGGVLSPLLSNVYLHKFDHWVTTALIPAHTRGHRRKANPAYHRIIGQLYERRKLGTTQDVKALLKHRRTLPSVDPNDPSYRRLRYVRYADDFLLGYVGTHHEAEGIKRHLTDWLRDNLKLNLSDEKTLITHASTHAARFVGYDISVTYHDAYRDRRGSRNLNGHVALRMPAHVVETRCARYTRNGVVLHRSELRADSDYDIVMHYQQQYRGIVQYYLPAQNVAWLTKLRYVMEMSLLKTLAAKHKTSAKAVADKLRTTVQTPDGKTLKAMEVRVERQGKPPLIARFGGIPLARQPFAILDDQPGSGIGGRTELIQRLLADVCELCGSTEQVEVHHIHKLADLKQPGRKAKPLWAQRMIARRRKTLVVCRVCHVAIHAGRPTRQPTLT
jgi:group II intron reverse transcriptase/maturase